MIMWKRHANMFYTNLKYICYNYIHLFIAQCKDFAITLLVTYPVFCRMVHENFIILQNALTDW